MIAVRASYRLRRGDDKLPGFKPASANIGAVLSLCDNTGEVSAMFFNKKAGAISKEKPSAANIESRQRGIYLLVRIRELKSELTSLQAEKKAVFEKLKGMTDRTSAEAKELKKRRIYLARRPIDAKAELLKATEERKSLAEKMPA